MSNLTAYCLLRDRAGASLCFVGIAHGLSIRQDDMY